MKRTPIIVVGQVYLHNDLNEYAVVVKSTRQQIQYRGKTDSGQIFGGLNEAEVFLERFGPVDPADLTKEEVATLTSLLDKPMPLSIGWVCIDDEEDDDCEEQE